MKIDRYYARVLPQDKAALIHRLKAEQPIAFVGDGIDDALALTEADLGLAIGAILMSVSTVVVSINAMLLRRIKLTD